MRLLLLEPNSLAAAAAQPLGNKQNKRSQLALTLVAEIIAAHELSELGNRANVMSAALPLSLIMLLCSSCSGRGPTGGREVINQKSVLKF